MGEMLSEKDVHGLIEHMDITERRLMGTLALIVQNGLRHIPVGGA